MASLKAVEFDKWPAGVREQTPDTPGQEKLHQVLNGLAGDIMRVKNVPGPRSGVPPELLRRPRPSTAAQLVAERTAERVQLVNPVRTVESQERYSTRQSMERVNEEVLENEEMNNIPAMVFSGDQYTPVDEETEDAGVKEIIFIHDIDERIKFHDITLLSGLSEKLLRFVGSIRTPRALKQVRYLLKVAELEKRNGKRKDPIYDQAPVNTPKGSTAGVAYYATRIAQESGFTSLCEYKVRCYRTHLYVEVENQKFEGLRLLTGDQKPRLASAYGWTSRQFENQRRAGRIALSACAGHIGLICLPILARSEGFDGDLDIPCERLSVAEGQMLEQRFGGVEDVWARAMCAMGLEVEAYVTGLRLGDADVRTGEKGAVPEDLKRLMSDKIDYDLIQGRELEDLVRPWLGRKCKCVAVQPSTSDEVRKVC